MTLLEIVVVVCLAFFCIGMVTIAIFSFLEDTETFKAIDEKIAEIIRGKEE